MRSDITRQSVDAIVNAANPSLLGGGGVDAAIHAAGGPAILAECRQLRRDRWPNGLPVGQAAATGAGELPARWVIHTVGPVFTSTEDRSALLRSCYENSLRVAAALGAETIAFPLISAGAYGWPLEDAAYQAVRALNEAKAVLAEARLVLFSGAAYQAAAAAAVALIGE